jgi:hypothetical protein
MNTNEAAANAKKELNDVMSKFCMLRDEIRVKMHLASMDAKERWSAIEDQVARVEHAATEQATVATRTAVTEAIKKLTKFRESLSGA